MKTISIFLSLINSLLAGVILLATLTGNEINEAAFLWLLIKILASGSVIGIGILTLLGNMSTVKAGPMAVSSLFLVALGAATAVWTLHLAMVTGDIEFYMIIYGGSLMTQGAASLLCLAEVPRNVTPA
jgi:hypothetical protein